MSNKTIQIKRKLLAYGQDMEYEDYCSTVQELCDSITNTQYTCEEVVEIVEQVLEATGKEIGTTIKNIGTLDAYVEFDDDDLEQWINNNLK